MSAPLEKSDNWRHEIQVSLLIAYTKFTRKLEKNTKIAFIFITYMIIG